MNVDYKHTPYNYKSSGLIVLKGPLFPQKHRPASYVLVTAMYLYTFET